MNAGALDDCGCCEGLTADTPAPVANRHGLRTIAYRCGTHEEFKKSMLAALSASTRPALRGLNTRDDDDFSIALLDAWACVADVMTFYQERIAQESYLRTANERVSLLQLARLIGYELRPGVAASAYLAFTLECAAGAPSTTTINIGTKVQSIPGPGEKAQTFETVEKIEARVEWNAIPARRTEPQRITSSTTSMYLEGTGTNLKSGDVLLVLDSRLLTGDTRSWRVARVKRITPDFTRKHTFVELQKTLEGFDPAIAATVEVHALRQRTALFGFNAPDPHVLADSTLLNLQSSLAVLSLTLPLGKDVDWSFGDVTPDRLDLDALYPGITAGDDSWLVISNPDFATTPLLLCRVTAATEISRAGFTMTARVSRLGVDLMATPGFPPILTLDAAKRRQTTIFAQSERLKLAPQPIDSPVVGTRIRLDGDHPFEKRRVVAISGARKVDGTLASTLARVVETISSSGGTEIRIAPGLNDEMDVNTLTVNANVALATHGESVEEVLGSGDSSQSYQQFTLRQPPLTFVRGTSASGAESTLQVRVNDLLWHQTPSLFGCGPRDRVFVTHSGDDGATTVQFGDGATGARPPTGQDNVRATYRKGIGTDGLVKADQLSMLVTRPLGTKAVTNPQRAEGAANRELLDDARSNASLTILTLDRIVSLHDYEDFVRAYAGIAKALATWTWNGHTRGVFVTVAGPGGSEVDMTGEFGTSLLAAVTKAAEPFVDVHVQSYRPSDGRFTLSVSVKIDPAHESSRVLAGVKEALRAAFSFDARQFGAAVNVSDVIAVIHATQGVVAVDVDRLVRSDAPPASPQLNARLLAAVPQAGSSTSEILPAELLTIDAASLDDIGTMA